MAGNISRSDSILKDYATFARPLRTDRKRCDILAMGYARNSVIFICFLSYCSASVPCLCCAMN